MLSRRLVLALAATASLVASAGTAIAADAYPSRTVTLMVPYAAGGASDTVGRILAESMTQTLGQQVIVENVGGASGTIGAARVAKADPDGYTLLLHTPSHATNTLLFRKLPYDPKTAFQPIGVVTETPMTVVGKADLPPSTAPELLDYIRANKDKITIGNAGLGGPSHLCGMLMMSMLDSPMTPVSYKGVGPAMIDLLGGQIDLMCDQATNTISHIRSGKIKAFAVTTTSRIPDLPDLPTLDEVGLRGFETTVWHGLYAPAGIPKEVLDRLVDTLRTAVQNPTVAKRLGDLATVPVAPERATPEALQTTYQAEIAKWDPLVKAAGLYAD
jgi:tripartite-type tricarboxylate transporter receptor subunit TctC